MIEPIPEIKRIFAANRGLPAIEIIDAVHGMGLEAAIGATPSDTRSQSYRKADAKTGLPVSESHVERDSYVNIQWMLEAATRTEADAIHPGYGFLSEDPEFARQVELFGLHFIGPTVNALAVFGSKTRYRQHAMESGVPVIPASRLYIYKDGVNGATGGFRHGITERVGKVGSLFGKGYSKTGLSRVTGKIDKQPVQLARALAATVTEQIFPTTLEQVILEAIGFIEMNGDIVVKSPYGGGGMGTALLPGIAKLLSEDRPLALKKIEGAIRASNRTSERARRSGVYFEKLIANAGHLEMQVIADKHGNVHVLKFERDCSWQINARKMVEQSPSSKIDTEERETLRHYAAEIIRNIHSHGVFTVEFLKDMDEGGLYSLEVNPRLQVEHKVSEFVTHIGDTDILHIIPTQVDIANGKRIDTLDHEARGHSVQARILVNVDESTGGYLTDFKVPDDEGIHVIANFDEELYVPGGYDGHIAKIIAVGENAEQANERLLNALTNTRITGAPNNIRFIVENMKRPEFHDGSYTTRFVSNATMMEIFQS
jgi:acetyl/propionyl-CoA carboxylase alpha subunit